MPPANNSAGLALSGSILGQYVGDVNVGATSGIIIATMNGAKANAKLKQSVRTIQFSSIRNAGSLEWHCKSDTIPQKWCPSSCVCTGAP